MVKGLQLLRQRETNQFSGTEGKNTELSTVAGHAGQSVSEQPLPRHLCHLPETQPVQERPQPGRGARATWDNGGGRRSASRCLRAGLCSQLASQLSSLASESEEGQRCPHPAGSRAPGEEDRAEVGGARLEARASEDCGPHSQGG